MVKFQFIAVSLALALFSAPGTQAGKVLDKIKNSITGEIVIGRYSVKFLSEKNFPPIMKLLKSNGLQLESVDIGMEVNDGSSTLVAVAGKTATHGCLAEYLVKGDMAGDVFSECVSFPVQKKGASILLKILGRILERMSGIIVWIQSHQVDKLAPRLADIVGKGLKKLKK